jgi:hypothetical protein
VARGLEAGGGGGDNGPLSAHFLQLVERGHQQRDCKLTFQAEVHYGSCKRSIFVLLLQDHVTIMHSWPLTDLSVTSGTGLTMMPECRCRTKQ